MTDTRVAQVDEDLPDTWLGCVDFFNLGRDLAWLIVHESLVLRGDLGGSHIELSGWSPESLLQRRKRSLVQDSCVSGVGLVGSSKLPLHNHGEQKSSRRRVT
jgi:hypothetical protein